MRYGIPYQGSKNSIAREIVRFLPAAGTLIDICAGGCAITHAALELCDGIAPKWERIISNDINPMPGKLFRDAIDGKYAHETRWISREDFHRLKGSDPYVAYCWSFGNKARDYLYSYEVEPWKRSVHYARVLGDMEPLQEFGIESDGSPADIRAHEQEYKEKYIRWMVSKPWARSRQIDNHQKSLGRLHSLQSLESLQRLQRLQNLQRLEKLPALNRLTHTVLSYDCVEIPEDSVVYADIPYQNTNCVSYEGFDHQKFFDWAARQRVPVFISSYQIDDPRFVCVWEREKRCLLQAVGGGALRTERIYTHLKRGGRL